MFRKLFLTSILLLTILAACGGAGEPTAGPEKETAMKLELTSTAFQEGNAIPTKHTCDGPDLSPPLTWNAPPDGAKSLALTCDDPDAPLGTWVHWVLYDLPPDTTSLAEGIAPDKQLIGGAKQGTNDFGKFGYGGPCPPKGSAHRYFFKLYALDAELGLAAGATNKDLLKAMEGHVLAEGQLVGLYQR
jgi:Raf kinase inhibitor-like YbhB/YbcL family protein